MQGYMLQLVEKINLVSAARESHKKAEDDLASFLQSLTQEQKSTARKVPQINVSLRYIFRYP